MIAQMTSAVATGGLFTPRIASLCGFIVPWIMVLVIDLEALIAREIGRYAVEAGDPSASHRKRKGGVPGYRNVPSLTGWESRIIMSPST